MQRQASSEIFPLGSGMPQFRLPNVDGRMVGNEFFTDAAASLIVFTCNHCPYVKGSEEMLRAVYEEWHPRGLKVIGISSNDAVQYPEDSFDKMKEKSIATQLPWPYLYDESQSVARAFDAACTPECYLFNKAGLLCYHGAINNSPKDPSQASQNHLLAAVSQCIERGACSPSYVHPIGCSIKWKM